jgi:hypothetical protein
MPMTAASPVTVRLAALLLAICVLCGSASGSTQEWRIRTKGSVDSALFSAHRLVWAEAVGSNGFRVLAGRLGEQPHLVAQIPNRRVRLGGDGDDWAYLSLAAWPGGIAYGYSREDCFRDCFGRAVRPYSSQMRIVVAPFGRKERVLWTKSCPPSGHTLPQVAITHRTLLTSRGSCTNPPSKVEESDLLGRHRRELPVWTTELHASGSFASFFQPAVSDDAPSVTAVMDLRTRKTVLSLPGAGPTILASDGALIFSTQPQLSEPWQVMRVSPAEPSPHPIVDNLPDSPAAVLVSHGRIAIARSGESVERPTRVDIFTRSGRRLGGLAKAVHGEVGADVVSFDGRHVAWVIRAAEDPGPETIVVRCVLDCG